MKVTFRIRKINTYKNSIDEIYLFKSSTIAYNNGLGEQFLFDITSGQIVLNDSIKLEAEEAIRKYLKN